MDFLVVLGIAFGLAMDAFSVAVAAGISMEKISTRQALRLAHHFGLFQFGMPIIGWVLGSLVAEQVQSVGTWIAFILLTGIGLKMIWQALRGNEEEVRGDPTRGASLIMLSFATSLDAMAVGLSLAVVGVPVLYPSIVIGAVAGNMTLLGLWIGGRAGGLLGRRMEVVGGLVLVGIGARLVM